MVILVLIFGAFLSGGLPKSAVPPSTDATPTPQVVDVAPNPTNTVGSSLQIGDLPFVTLTPVPSPTPTSAPAPTPGPIDFSSSSLDWDDVYYAITNLKGIAGTSIDGSCETELEKAVTAEVGFPPSPHHKPDSRVGLCEHNAACKSKGFAAYDGKTPLPQSVPSSTCQKQISDAFYAIVDAISGSSSLPSLYKSALDTYVAELKPPVFPNCDATDSICYDQ